MIIKNIISYQLLIIVSALFMLFLDGPGGSYLLCALIIAEIISVSICIYTKKTLSAELKLDENILNKGDTVRLSLKLSKKGFIPTSFITAEFVSSVHFSSDGNDKLKIVIFGKDETAFEKIYRAGYFGNGKIGVSSIIVSDYLGLLSFNIYIRNSLSEVKIYPNIPEISGRDSFARSLTDAVTFDDDEETASSSNNMNGFPGYDHRKYAPGDNLKLVNWKLSAKRGELFVRLLEGVGSAEQIFVLEKRYTNIADTELAAEALLGMAMIFAKSELPLRVLVQINESWEEIAVKNISDLYTLRYRMTEYSIVTPEGIAENRFPPEVNGERAVVFSPLYDEGLCEYLNSLMLLGKEYCAAVSAGEITDSRVRRIERDNLNIRFSD